ncbi:substrate-binding protein [Halosegnis marinus]|uniref:Substrate-binding protein n=1 Tax=Halosegnis marinus TaxID=3034023 RepID=A0ABD5ZRC0_9EURY|nr:substrate-binding protein [Halosegnis sp. DT85]
MERRDVLKGAGAAGIAGLAGCIGGGGGSSEYPELGNYPVEGDEVTLGFNVPQSGAYASEGNDELRAYNLAVEHLNNGGGWVDMWDDLSSGGILDKTVTSVSGDTATDPATAEESATQMIRSDGAIMITGGVSSSVAISQQKLCQQERVQFMSCLTHSNATQGADCVRYGFREMHNAYMTGKALAPILVDQFGEDQNFYSMYADYTWGTSNRDSMKEFLEERGWNQVEAAPTPLGTSDFSPYMQDVPREETDVLLLIHFGADAANSIPAAFDAGLDDDMEIVVPLYDKIAANAASDNIDGVLGTVDWNWQVDNEYSNAFTEAYREAEGTAPSYAARLAYSATMRYAAAVERAETFYPPEVIREMEDQTYSNTGIGEAEARACDHQSMRDVYVVEGLPVEEQTDDALLSVVGTTDRDTAGYACDAGPAANCELGTYGDEDN